MSLFLSLSFFPFPFFQPKPKIPPSCGEDSPLAENGRRKAGSKVSLGSRCPCHGWRRRNGPLRARGAAARKELERRGGFRPVSACKGGGDGRLVLKLARNPPDANAVNKQTVGLAGREREREREICRQRQFTASIRIIRRRVSSPDHEFPLPSPRLPLRRLNGLAPRWPLPVGKLTDFKLALSVSVSYSLVAALHLSTLRHSRETCNFKIERFVFLREKEREKKESREKNRRVVVVVVGRGKMVSGMREMERDSFMPFGNVI